MQAEKHQPPTSGFPDWRLFSFYLNKRLGKCPGQSLFFDLFQCRERLPRAVPRSRRSADLNRRISIETLNAGRIAGRYTGNSPWFAEEYQIEKS